MISTLLRESGRIAALRGTPAGLRRLRDEAPALVVKCRKYPALARRQWHAMQKMASVAAWLGDDLQPHFTFLLAMIDVCLGQTTALREGLEEIGGAASDLSALEEARTALQSLRSEVSGIADWMAAPPPKRKLRTTEEIRAGMARGEYISIEEAIAQAGGNLSETP